jgi:hypothetical protein
VTSPGKSSNNHAIVPWEARRKLFVIGSRSLSLLLAVIVGCTMLAPSRANAQWWRSGPADFEDCADAAEKSASKEARTAALAECNAKFAGRRKPGGGYTYFDFMQNRSFDIAGPNPTPEEQKHIDQQYTIFLDQERRNRIAAALTQAQLERKPQLQQVSLMSETVTPLPKPPPKARANASEPRLHQKLACTEDSFSCKWPRLSESINNLKKALFTSSASKPKRG